MYTFNLLNKVRLGRRVYVTSVNAAETRQTGANKRGIYMILIYRRLIAFLVIISTCIITPFQVILDLKTLLLHADRFKRHSINGSAVSCDKSDWKLPLHILKAFHTFSIQVPLRVVE
jgi:hypothetical protein